MKPLLFCAAIAGAMPGAVHAAPLAPLKNARMDGIPLSKALATLEVLGEWRLTQGGLLRLVTVGSEHWKNCASPDIDSSDCSLRPLYIVAYEAPTIPMGFTLFRGQESLAWVVPEDEKPGVDDKGNFTLKLLACDAVPIKTADGPDFELVADAYLLHVGERLNADLDKHVAFLFDASLEKLPGPRVKCP